MSLVVPFPGLGIDFRGGTYPWSTGTSNLVDVTTHFALLCQRLAIELCLGKSLKFDKYGFQGDEKERI